MNVQKASSNPIIDPESLEKPNPPSAPGAQFQPNSSPKKGKDKKIFSCHSCRRRKLKCDRFNPCGACEARGDGNSCTWEEGQRPERNYRGSLEQLPQLILKLTDEIQELKTSNSALMKSIKSKGEDPPGSLDLTPLDTRLAVLLPESQLLWGLISHYISASSSLTGFIDVPQLICDVEEVQHLQQSLDLASSPSVLSQLNVKVSMILACASLAAVDLTPMQAEVLGLANKDLDALVRDLWNRSRTLISSPDLDSFPPCAEVVLHDGRKPPQLETNNSLLQPSGAPTAAATDNVPLQVVSIKILLLLAARSFAAPSEYLKLHLDVISSAIDASLDSPCDEGAPLVDREWRWQLWSFICFLDWTSPGTYHNSSYFMRAEMHRDPPSKVPGLPDDGISPSAIEPGRRDRLNQTRNYLDFALALAHLSRRAEDSIIRPGPVSPAQAAQLCTELDAVYNKLSYYQLLGGSILPGGGAFNSGGMPVDTTTTSAGGNPASHKHGSTEHLLFSLARAPMIQKMHLSLELGLIRFKLFRHEAFYLMHTPSMSGALDMMCMDACMDACIFVLAQCWSIGNCEVPGIIQAQQHQLPTYLNAPSEKNCPSTGTLRRVLQPASSAALVGQVLLHAAQRVDETMGTSEAGQGKRFPVDLKSGSRGGTSASAEFAPAANMPPQGPYTSAASGSWNGRMSGEKVIVLQWHINKVLGLLQALQGTSSLARYKLSLYRQCM